MLLTETRLLGPRHWQFGTYELALNRYILYHARSSLYNLLILVMPCTGNHFCIYFSNFACRLQCPWANPLFVSRILNMLPDLAIFCQPRKYAKRVYWLPEVSIKTSSIQMLDSVFISGKTWAKVYPSAFTEWEPSQKLKLDCSKRRYRWIQRLCFIVCR